MKFLTLLIAFSFSSINLFSQAENEIFYNLVKEIESNDSVIYINHWEINNKKNKKVRVTCMKGSSYKFVLINRDTSEQTHNIDMGLYHKKTMINCEQIFTENNSYMNFNSGNGIYNGSFEILTFNFPSIIL